MPTSAQSKSDQLISRRELALRWSTSVTTIKRREREGVLKRMSFNSRVVRFRLADIEAVEIASMSH